MSGPLRSKQGCWTCRLRKKKCDERRPNCSTCESLLITCYGFGPKPEWMENGEEERAVANSIKEIVKHTSRRKATTQLTKQHNAVIEIAPKPANGSEEVSPPVSVSSTQHEVSPPSHHEPPENDVHMAGSMSSILPDDSVLLMHFIDKVFPLQYPMYNPGIIAGGRGWLLSIILRTKPLYYATLALSAYHRRTTIHTEISHRFQVTALVQQEKYLEICLKSVNQFAQLSCPKNGLGIGTAVLQLVFFELFTGHGNVWQTHFRAVTNMYQQGYKNNLGHFGLEESSRTIVWEDLPLPEYDPAVVEEVVIFRFLTGTIIWLDIISSITAGTAPSLLPYHFSVFTSTSQTKLEDIMGCKNWVMLQIGRISALYGQTTQAVQLGHFDCAPFRQTMDDIGKEIRYGLTQETFESFNISQHSPATTLETAADPAVLVTHIFAHMATIYLHLVTRGFQTLEELDEIISTTMRLLQTQTSIHVLPALVMPLYVIGSVARQEDKQFFRNIFSSLPVLNPTLKHREGVLPILEEIWSRRQIMDDLTWRDCVGLSQNILLI